MAAVCLFRLLERVLSWLAAEERRTRGTMASSHQELVRALAHDKGSLNLSKGLEAKGLMAIGRTPRARWNAST